MNDTCMPEPKKRGEGVVKLVGGLLAFPAPLLMTPLGLNLPFYSVGFISGLIGFYVTWFVFTRMTEDAAKVIWTVLFGIAAMVFLVIFQKLVLSPVHVSPGDPLQILELTLFGLFWLSFFALLAAGYKIGGDDLLDRYLSSRENIGS
jgi:hypothetical protein